MDNIEENAYQALEDKYLEDNAKFKKGDIVYYEYSYTKNNQQKLGVSIGIITDRQLSKRTVSRGDKSYVTHDIVYNIIHPRGTIVVTECKCTSVSAYIYREYLKNR